MFKWGRDAFITHLSSCGSRLIYSTYLGGNGYDEALRKVYGFDMDGLDALWKNYIISQRQATEVTVHAGFETFLRQYCSSDILIPEIITDAL